MASKVKKAAAKKPTRYIGLKLDQDVYQLLVERSEREMRSVSNMIAFFVAQGVNTAPVAVAKTA